MGNRQIKILAIYYADTFFLSSFKDSLPAYAKTFDQALAQMKASEVDGIFTDFPDLAVDYFDRQLQAKD
jgi:glycerophosphoryl diester phosphodiesterase